MTLDGQCDCCGKVRSAGSLNLVLIRPKDEFPHWTLLCGPCFVDGFTKAET